MSRIMPRHLHDIKSNENEIRKNPELWKIYSKIKSSWIGSDIRDGDLTGRDDGFGIDCRIGHELRNREFSVFASIIEDGGYVRVYIIPSFTTPYLQLQISVTAKNKEESDATCH
jgi:hypothetical protein